jgi:hypothetical protein
MMTTRRTLIAIATGLALTLGAASSAVADVPDPYEEARAFWTSHGVPAEVQDTLVDELSTTGAIDAIRHGVDPVSVETLDESDATVTVSTFPDGSISVTSVEKPVVVPPGQITTQASIAGCTAQGGSGYVNYTGCVVSADAAIFKIAFKASYSVPNGASAKITSTWGAQATSGVGTITNPTRTLWRPQASSVQQAVAKYHSDYTAWSSGLQQDVYLGFWLTSTGQTSTSTS